MSWLSEIEDEANLALEGDEAFTGGYMDDLRMAGVIHELARVAKRLERCDTDGREPTCPFCGLRNDHKDCIYSNLSPDAKELINDTTAPRST